jgi:hypothetical protein
MNRRPIALPMLLAAACSTSSAWAQGQKLHYTYLWHLEQPVYWPDRDRTPGAADRYELAWPSILRKDAGAANPNDDLRGIFGLSDRVNAYQWRTRDSINAFRWTSEGGAQISYSGGLIENITSLGNANQLGYSPTWFAGLREARGWTTSGGKPRADIVQFGFHHPLMPLLDTSALRKELQLYKAIYPDAWGSGTPSRGLFPSEMAFSTRIIEALAAEGIAWSIVSAEKISRACVDFPLVLGSGGVNCDPPNKADQINPGGNAYYRVQISRGCAPAEAYPFSLTPRRARYVNPETGAISSIIVVPSPQAVSWEDGYAAIGLGHFNALQTLNDGNRPMLLVLAHDGDNAWGGGYSYYMEATPNLASQASGAGYVTSTVEQYLQDHPVPANDFVHVEDGAWVNADGDFGSPQFINWNWPLLDASGAIDPVNGWHVDPRNWAVITAANNRVETAEQIATRPGGPQPTGLNIRNILYPQNASTTNAERAWHYFLGGLNSGFMYYGNAGDMEVKPTIAANEAVRCADQVIGTGTLDTTGPTIWIPQRHPWNPGSTNFGPQYGYRQVQNNGDFWVWTFAYDVSGIGSVTLKYRVDNDGQRSLSNTENETYAGGPGVGAWQSVPMNRRVFPAGNVYNYPDLNFFEMPTYIADHYSAQITGLRSKLVDYYVEAVDARGNIRKSPIQHVWIGDGTGAGGGGGGGGSVVTISPAAPAAGQSVTVTYNPAGRNLASAANVYIHYGFNQWTGVPAVDPLMTRDNATGKWSYTLTLPTTASQLDCVFNNGAGTWDNNSGADWHFAVTGAVQPFVMDGQLDSGATAVGTAGGRTLWAALRGNQLYVASTNASTGQDAFIYLAQTPGALRAAQWGKAGQVAGWDAFLAAESTNSYIGWFDAAGATQQGRGATGAGVMEGTIDLVGEFGSLPSRVYLASATFATADGGALSPASQIGPSLNNNTTLDAGEYVAVDLCRLTAAGCCPADYNRDTFLNLDDLGDFITDFYINPPIPGGVQANAPTFAGVAVGSNVPCPGAGDAPAPYAADAYRTQGYRTGFSIDGSGNCPPLGPNLDNLGDFITAYYSGC